MSVSAGGTLLGMRRMEGHGAREGGQKIVYNLDNNTQHDTRDTEKREEGVGREGGDVGPHSNDTVMAGTAGTAGTAGAAGTAARRAQPNSAGLAIANTTGANGPSCGSCPPGRG